MDTHVYIDGFNLYYGLLRGSPHKWLDLERFCDRLLPRNNVIKIRYFTAKLDARPQDPDQPTRQFAYLQALTTLTRVEGHMGEFWAAVIGAIVGAIAGGGIAALLQKWQYSREKRDRERALAQALFFKVLRIHSDLEGYRRHVADCSAFAAAKGLRDGWQSLKPIGNGPPKIAFVPEEMALLLDLRKFDLLNTILSLDAVHGSTIDIFALYASRRAAMGALIGADRMEGQIGSVGLSDEMMHHAGPLGAELDDIVTQIKARADRDAQEAWEGVTGLNDALQPKLGYRLTLEPVAGLAPVAVQATGVTE